MYFFKSQMLYDFFYCQIIPKTRRE